MSTVLLLTGLVNSPAALSDGTPRRTVATASLSEDPLIVPGMQVLDGDEQRRDAREAQRQSPEAFSARQRSKWAYVHLTAAQARAAAARLFPELIDEPAGGPPSLPRDEKIVAYPSNNIAVVERASRRGQRPEHSVIESFEPMALSTSSGHHEPIDLHLQTKGSYFEPALPVVRVRLPKSLNRGIVLGRTGVSLTPIDSHGAPLGGSEGVIDGTTVVYANSIESGDTVVKPTTTGFSAETLLRAKTSPKTLAFRIDVPGHASIVRATDGTAVHILLGDETIASISAPAAHDAENTPVPVRWHLSGNILEVALPPQLDSYRLPIVVDPTAEDNIWQNEHYYETYYRTNWEFHTNGTAFTAPAHPENGSWTETIAGNHTGSEWGGLLYTTRGESQIVTAHVEGNWNDTSAHIQNFVELETGKSPYLEDYSILPVATEPERGGGGYACLPAQNCPETIAGSAPPENHNTAEYLQESTGAGEGHGGTNTVTKAYVQISQEKGPTIEFNKTSPTLHNPTSGENVPNVLYGSGEWLGPHHGAFEVRADDPGIGISFYRVEGGGAFDEHFFFAEGDCFGIQCPEYVHQAYTYNGMRSGEDPVEVVDEDYAKLYATILPQQVVKVDASKPYGIKLQGFTNGNQLPLGETHLKAEATDGEGTTKSSGLKSITISVDGHEIPTTGGSCPQGPCSATAEFALLARDYTSGNHSLVVTATDNAYNVTQEEFVFRVLDATPLTLGPGQVDPSTGEYTLSATDATLGGTTGITRTYHSRRVGTGPEGPLGPQWELSIGGGESLMITPEGEVDVTIGTARTTFERNEKGEYVSPSGDANLHLEAKESEPGKGISYYLLTDSASGTKTKFQQPAGIRNTAPTYESEFGPTAKAAKPTSTTVDQSGNVWVVSDGTDLIEKYSSEGVLLESHGAFGTSSGQLNAPWGLAVNPSNGNLYISDAGNNRIEELSATGGFIRAFGWGVKDAQAQYEICETTECKAGVAGSGAGQLNSPKGITIDASGNVWVADCKNNRIDEYGATGNYKTAVGEGKLICPAGVAISGETLYVADSGHNRIAKFKTTNGEYTGQLGEQGTGKGQLANPYGVAVEAATGNVYAADSNNNRIEEFTSGGSATFGAKGTGAGQFGEGGPGAVGISSQGVIYAADPAGNRVETWTRPLWLPSEVGGALAATNTTFTYEAVEQESKAIIRPAEALAPIAPGITSCTPLARGCRALTFNYANTTTATGERESEWGDYKGRMTRVYAHLWDPEKGAMTETEIVHYLYDKQGRLRAEWDPRIEKSAACGKTCPALKTTYGYDAEGHVTSLRPAGEQPWIFTYGAIAGDATAGRLLKVNRPNATAPLTAAEPPSNTELPKVTGAAVTGVVLGVSTGKWTGEVASYAYQWQDCNSEGQQCSPIQGATSPNYTVSDGDVGHRIVATVTATNGGGSQTASSAATVEANRAEVTEYALTAGSEPSELVLGPDGNYWMVNTGGAKILKVSPTGSVLAEYSLAAGSSPYAITVGSDNNLWITEFAGNAIVKMTTSGAKTEYSLPSGSYPTGITAGPDGNLWYTTWGTNKVGKITTAGQKTEYSLQGKHPHAITTGPDGRLWATETGSNMVARVTTAGSVNEFSVPGEPFAIVSGPDGNLWVTRWTLLNSGLSKITTAGTVTAEYSLPASSHPDAITVGADKNLWLTEFGTSKVVRATTAGALTEVNLPSNSEPNGIVSGPAETLYFADYGTSHLGRIYLSPKGGEQYSSQPGSTIEYGVPVSGGNAPRALGAKEVEAWGQKDDPVEGVAIFPPDEPQGWPASSYKRATISYWDSHGRLVNTTTPTGAIATSEYNESNDVIRSLTPDNREAALKEGSKSAEVAKLLDTESRYNGETESERTHEAEEAAQGLRSAPEPGTELLETKGPQHKVKLAEGGTEVLARNHVRYYYDEGSPEGKHHGLQTKTVDGAEYEGKEADLRTTTKSYAGQSGLGWTLRKPTSATVDPNGLNLTTQTVYDEHGNVVETVSPGASATHPMPTFSFTFGSYGKGEGQFEAPWGVAVSPKNGNVYVSDYAAGRVGEFSSAGKFLAWVGSPGSGEGQMSKPEAITVDSSGNLWVGDSGNDRIDEFNEKNEPVRHFGSKGSGSGQFASYIMGIAIGGGYLWVSDTGNDRVEKFSLSGNPEGSFGKEGSLTGQFYGPTGIAVSGEHLYVGDYGNHRVQQFTFAGEYKMKFGEWGKGNGQLEDPVGLAADLKTGDIYVSDYGSDRVEQFTGSGSYVAWLGSYGQGAGQIYDPEAIATAAAGTMYIADRGNARAQAWAPGYASVRRQQIFYYTSESNQSEPNCGGHPEWAGLICKTTPVGPSEDAPTLPSRKFLYNVWDEVTTTEEAFGSTLRTKAESYDPAGRALTSSTTSSVDAPVPTVTNEYSAESGAVVKQTSELNSVVKTVTSKVNTLGQLVEYNDAEGNVAKYEYETGSDSRLLGLTEGKGEEIHATQTYSYDPTTGLRTKLVDSGAGTFTATYDPEGRLATQTYPGGLRGKYGYDATGQPTEIEYAKTTNCTEHCIWFTDAQTPSVHGEPLVQTSSLATEHYTFDNAGRLTQAQEEPTGKPCVTRLYTYDVESNRTSLISRQGTEGKCATEGGTVERHAYDSANRLIDTGVTYDPLGNTTHLSATDTGTGHELTSTYFVDNQLESQTQNSETISYTYDPVGRTLTSHHSKTNTTAVEHYGGPDEGASWVSEGTSIWTRDISGLEGSLAATETSAGAVTLQLRDLNGNIVATAGASESETKLESTYNSTEFGVPQAGTTPPKYAWMGAEGVTTETSLGAGGVADPGGSSYVPLVGRALQTEQIASPGAFPDGAAATGVVQASYLGAAAGVLKGIAVAHEAALEAAARQQAEEEAALNACPSSACGPFPEEDGAEETGGGWVDPYLHLKLSAKTTKALLHAVTAGGPALATVIGRYVKGIDGMVLAKGIEALTNGAQHGLNACLTPYYDAGKPSSYRCGITFHYEESPAPPYILPVSLKFESCWYDAKKKAKYDCGTVWTVSVIPGIT